MFSFMFTVIKLLSFYLNENSESSFYKRLYGRLKITQEVKLKLEGIITSREKKGSMKREICELTFISWFIEYILIGLPYHVPTTALAPGNMAMNKTSKSPWMWNYTCTLHLVLEMSQVLFTSILVQGDISGWADLCQEECISARWKYPYFFNQCQVFCVFMAMWCTIRYLACNQIVWQHCD